MKKITLIALLFAAASFAFAGNATLNADNSALFSGCEGDKVEEGDHAEDGEHAEDAEEGEEAEDAEEGEE